MEDRPGFLAIIILKVVSLVSTLIQIAIWVLFLVLFIIATYEDKNKDLCTAYKILSKQLGFTLPDIGRICQEPREIKGMIFLIALIAFSLFLFLLPYIVKKFMRKGLQTCLSVISIFILTTLVYIYNDQITHWLLIR